MDSKKQFDMELSKLQNQYNYDSKGHGGIEIYESIEDGKFVAVLNWSASGSQYTKYARAFAEALLEATEACEKFNSKYSFGI